MQMTAHCESDMMSFCSDVMPGGGRRVAEMMGGTTVGVPCSVRDAVAKTAAAAKMPTPAAYIVPTKEPNAFAAGRGRDRVVAVTQGLVDLLDRCRPRAEILCAIASRRRTSRR